MMKHTTVMIGVLLLAGCTAAPEKTPTKTAPTQPPKKVTQPSSGVKITPYDQKEIKRQSVPVVVPQQKVQQTFEPYRVCRRLFYLS